MDTYHVDAPSFLANKQEINIVMQAPLIFHTLAGKYKKCCNFSLNQVWDTT